MKKNKKNFLRHWKNIRKQGILFTLFAVICTFCAYSGAAEEKAVLPQDGKTAQLEAEVKRLKDEVEFKEKENAALRKELIDTLDKYSTQAGILRRIQMSAAGTIETLEPVYLGAGAMELAADLIQCITSLKRLSAEVLNFADDVDKILPEVIPDNVNVARMRIKVDALRRNALETARIAQPAQTPGKFEKSRIAELNDELKLAVIGAGYRDGLRTGMILEAGEVRLKIVAVRSFICAAAVFEGDFGRLALGQEVTSRKAPDTKE